MSEKKPYTTVLFDLDGTLTDPEIGITTYFSTPCSILALRKMTEKSSAA